MKASRRTDSQNQSAADEQQSLEQVLGERAHRWQLASVDWPISMGELAPEIRPFARMPFCEDGLSAIVRE
jgi:hypothetical protein